MGMLAQGTDAQKRPTVLSHDSLARTSNNRAGRRPRATGWAMQITLTEINLMTMIFFVPAISHDIRIVRPASERQGWCP